METSLRLPRIYQFRVAVQGVSPLIWGRILIWSDLSWLPSVLPEHITPALLCLKTKWAALVSHGVTAQLLHEVLPIDEALAPCTIREHVFTSAERLEQVLGEEQWSSSESCPSEWRPLPIPNGPLTMGIDGTTPVRNRSQAGSR
jgi:hypothetical protein